VAIPVETPAGSDFVIVVADAGQAIAESDDTNNALAKPLAIMPDLRIAALSAPSKAFPGTTISVSDTTRNQGAGAGISTTSLFLSADATLDADDLLLDSRTVPILAFNESSSAATPVAIPAELPGGTYFLIARADSEDAIPEVNEANNALARAFTVGPDLIVSILSIPPSAVVGATITATDTTLNQGSAAGASTMRFYLSAASVRAPGDPELASRAVPALGLGTSSAASTLLTIPAGTAPGNYFIIAECDADGAVAELTETNNTKARAIAINP
jgi:subtilase family serine protease